MSPSLTEHLVSLYFRIFVIRRNGSGYLRSHNISDLEWVAIYVRQPEPVTLLAKTAEGGPVDGMRRTDDPESLTIF
jgi:hypothetical protein